MNEAGQYCVKCPAGSFLTTLAGKVRCVPARVGHFAPEASLSDQACPDGFVAPLSGMSQCLPCLAGSRSLQDHTECVLCEKGTFSRADPGVGATECERCTDEIAAHERQCNNAYLNGTIYVSDQDRPDEPSGLCPTMAFSKGGVAVSAAAIFIVAFLSCFVLFGRDWLVTCMSSGRRSGRAVVTDESEDDLELLARSGGIEVDSNSM